MYAVKVAPAFMILKSRLLWKMFWHFGTATWERSTTKSPHLMCHYKLRQSTADTAHLAFCKHLTTRQGRRFQTARIRWGLSQGRHRVVCKRRCRGWHMDLCELQPCRLVDLSTVHLRWWWQAPRKMLSSCWKRRRNSRGLAGERSEGHLGRRSMSEFQAQAPLQVLLQWYVLGKLVRLLLVESADPLVSLPHPSLNRSVSAWMIACSLMERPS